MTLIKNLKLLTLGTLFFSFNTLASSSFANGLIGMHLQCLLTKMGRTYTAQTEAVFGTHGSAFAEQVFAFNLGSRAGRIIEYRIGVAGVEESSATQVYQSVLVRTLDGVQVAASENEGLVTRDFYQQNAISASNGGIRNEIVRCASTLVSPKEISISQSHSEDGSPTGPAR
jgi:hypothetical protein